MSFYKVLHKQEFTAGKYAIVPLRYDDRWEIMKWRNEQIFHLRQNKPLTKEDQENYFATVVASLFEREQPSQILFSYLENGVCIGYGGLVHINWVDQNAEVSFIMNTALEADYFELHWSNFLGLIEKVAFQELAMHKIFTFAFDLRPHLYPVLAANNFQEDARLKEHGFFENAFIDVLIHSKINPHLELRQAVDDDAQTTYEWANNPVIRKHSVQKTKIEFVDHLSWFTQKIHSSECVYLIAIRNDQPCGSIRFDINAQNCAVISYLLDPKFHGLGLGKVILLEGIRYLNSVKNVSKISGFVFTENIPSMKSFVNLGFQIVQDNEDSVVFEKEVKK